MLVLQPLFVHTPIHSRAFAHTLYTFHRTAEQLYPDHSLQRSRQTLQGTDECVIVEIECTFEEDEDGWTEDWWIGFGAEVGNLWAESARVYESVG